MNCKDVRTRLEHHGDDSVTLRHVAECSGCAEYVALQGWSEQVLKAGQLEVAPPLMSSIWASIHRASEQAWDSALTRSFRHLLPFMVAIIAIVLLVGGLTRPVVTATAPTLLNSPFAVLTTPEMPAVASELNPPDITNQDPRDILSAAHQ